MRVKLRQEYTIVTKNFHKKSHTVSKSRSVLVGIDEAGRGPFAGPLSLGLVAFKKNHNLVFRGLKDSKKLSPQARENWFKKIENWAGEGRLIFSHSFIHPKVIDEKGLAWALSYAVRQVIRKAGISREEAEILLDAGLKAPSLFIQKSIVKGDEKIKVISLASIVAKVKRDRYMVRIAKRYPKYNFEIHKGYGTAKHRATLKRYGPSPIHRKSFLA